MCSHTQFLSGLPNSMQIREVVMENRCGGSNGAHGARDGRCLIEVLSLIASVLEDWKWCHQHGLLLQHPLPGCMLYTIAYYNIEPHTLATVVVVTTSSTTICSGLLSYTVMPLHIHCIT